MKLSIVFGTLNRMQYLPSALESVRRAAKKLKHEIIIADGGSKDGTLDYLRKQEDVILIEQHRPLGCVKAFNACFWLARGRYVMNMNDDAFIVGDALINACKILDEQDDVGQVAIPFGFQGQIPEVSNVRISGRLVPYANFGVTMKCLGDKVGWWGGKDINLFRYAGDNQLSMNVFKEGCKVLPLPVEMGSIIHYGADDSTRVNSPDDTTKFYNWWKDFKWD